MTQNEILAMLHKVIAENQQFTTWTVSTPHLVALVNQAVEQERELCAKMCEDDDSEAGEWHWEAHVGGYFARAIRERTNDR